MIGRLSCFILLLFCSCCSFGQLQFTLFTGVVLGCDSNVIPLNSTIDAGAFQVGVFGSVALCVVNTGASPVTLTTITLSTTDFDSSKNQLPIVLQPNKGSMAVVGFSFTLTAAGTTTAVAGFVDDASGSPQTFTLSATGFTDFGLNTFLMASNSKTVTAGQTAFYNMLLAGAVTPPGPIAFNGVVSLTCSNLPPGASCAISPGAVSLSNGGESVIFGMNVSTTARPAASLHGPSTLGYSLAAVLALAVATSRKRLKSVALLACFLVLGLTVSCGGGTRIVSSLAATPTPAGTFSFQVNGTAGSTTHSKTMVLVVN